MPKGIVKAVVLVDDLDAVVRLLGEVAKVEPVVPYESTGEQAAIGLGWPADRGATRGAIVGTPPGMLELVEIPPALRDEVRPGVALLSIGARRRGGRRDAGPGRWLRRGRSARPRGRRRHDLDPGPDRGRRCVLRAHPVQHLALAT